MSKVDKNDLIIGYRITKIQSTKFSFVDTNEEILDELFASKKAAININLTAHIDAFKSTMTIDISSALFNTIDNEMLVEHNGRTSFFIRGLEKTKNETNGGFDLPNELLVQIHGIAYSHARALLASDLSSTCFRDKYFLPVVNPEELLKIRN